MRSNQRHFVKLEGASDLTDSDEPKWVQVALEGDYLGYAGGSRPFRFTRETFEQIQSNLRAHPAYKMGPDGFGEADVIPWDFNHASELHPAEGSLPFTGSPSHGWTRDFDVREGPDGKAQLWALTRFLEPARSYVRNGQMQWASVAVQFDAVDPVSGQNIGAIVTSIALTNTPFIEGMEKLVASKNAQGATLRRYYESADSPSMAVRMLRELFGLPETAGVAELSMEIAKLSQWLTTGAAPLGVELDELIAGMRCVFNLPALSSNELVIEYAEQMVPSLLEEKATNDMDDESASPDAAMANNDGDHEMDELIKALASKLGVRPNEDAVKDEVAQLVELRANLRTKLGADKDVASVLLAEADKYVGQSAKLGALLKALGVDDSEGAVEKVALLMEQAAELAAVKPELDELRKSKEEAAEKAIETDVAAAMQAHGFGDEMKEMLTLYRRERPESFANRYAKAPEKVSPAKRALAANPALTKKIVTDEAAPGIQGASEVHLSSYPGLNDTQRAMAYLKATHANFDKLTFERQFEMAVALKRQPHVIGSQAS